MSDRAFLIGSGAIVLMMVILGFFVFYPEPNVKAYEVELSDFIFIPKKGSFPITVNAGETVLFKVRNVGGFDHEFMIVTAEMKDMMLNKAAQVLSELLEMGLSGSELLEEYEHEMGGHGGEMGEGMFLMLRLEPGEELEGKVTFHEPGTYYVICIEAGGTAEAGKSHAHQGMVAEIIVRG